MNLKNSRWIGWVCVIITSGGFLVLMSPFYNVIWGPKSVKTWAFAIQKVCDTGRGLSVASSMQVSEKMLLLSDYIFDLFFLVFSILFGVFFLGIKIIRGGIGNRQSKTNNGKANFDLIFDSLRNGTVEDWERLAQQSPAFPHGVDRFVERHWITHAIDCGTLESVRWMISKGVNLRFVDDEGFSPLHSCIDREFPDQHEMLQLLIDSGADINIGTELGTMGFNGWSPLHMAAARNDLKAIKILLDNGADTTLKTIIDDYCTAEQEATIAGKHEAAELIRTHKRTPR